MKKKQFAKLLGIVYLITGIMLTFALSQPLMLTICILGLVLTIGVSGLWELIIAVMLILMLVIGSPLIVDVLTKGSNNIADYSGATAAIAAIVGTFLTYFIFLKQVEISGAQFKPQAILRNSKRKDCTHDAEIYNCGNVPITNTEVFIYFAGEEKATKLARTGLYGFYDQLGIRIGFLSSTLDYVIVPKEALPFGIEDFIMRMNLNIERNKYYRFIIFLKINYEDFEFTTKDYELLYEERSNEDGSYFSRTFIREQWIDNWHHKGKPKIDSSHSSKPSAPQK